MEQGMNHALHATTGTLVARQHVEGALGEELAARGVNEEINNHSKYCQHDNARHDNSLDGQSYEFTSGRVFHESSEHAAAVSHRSQCATEEH